MDKSKAKINPINKKDSKCFQYTVTVALNYDESKKIHKEYKLKPFINKYNWKSINFPIEYHLSEICHNFADNAFYGSKQNLGSF